MIRNAVPVISLISFMVLSPSNHILSLPGFMNYNFPHYLTEHEKGESEMGRRELVNAL
jgi:hypothetical protein